MQESGHSSGGGCAGCLVYLLGLYVQHRFPALHPLRSTEATDVFHEPLQFLVVYVSLYNAAALQQRGQQLWMPEMTTPKYCASCASGAHKFSLGDAVDGTCRERTSARCSKTTLFASVQTGCAYIAEA